MTEEELSAYWRDWDRACAAESKRKQQQRRSTAVVPLGAAVLLEGAVQAFCAERGLSASGFREAVADRRRAGDAIEAAIASAAGNE